MAKVMINGPTVQSHEQAFSTLEFVVAVTLCLIISVMGTAGFQFYQRDSPVRHAATRLQHACSSAHTYAVTNNTYYTVQINWASRNFWIDETDADGKTVNRMIVAPELLGDHVQVDSIHVGQTQVTPSTDTLTAVTFHPDGSGSDMTIVLKRIGAKASESGAYSSVKLYGPTGQCRVLEGNAATAANLTSTKAKRVKLS